MAKSKEREPVSGSQFPKMGESLLSNIVNVSGKRSSYTTMMPKKTMGRGASPTGKAAHKGATMIKEANGPKFSVQTTLYKQNAAEASQVLRNTKLVTPVIERPDHVGSGKTFWDKRVYGQKT